MKQILGGIAVALGGLGLFVGLVWLAMYATNVEQTTTNPILRLSIALFIWSLGAIIFAVFAYVAYHVLRHYTDPNMPLSQMRNHKKVGSPEFE